MSIIVDVGAAGFSRHNWMYKPKDVAYLFEPHPRYYKELEDEFSNMENIHLFNLALSNKIGYIDFYQTKKANCSSILEPNSLDDSIKDREEIKSYTKSLIQCDTLDNVLKDVNIVDYMKLDTQGSEYEIILGGSDIIKRTRFIKCEVEFTESYINQKLYNDVKSLLESFGFKETHLQKNSKWHGDAFFENTKIIKI